MSRSTRVRSLVQAEVAADGERLSLDLGVGFDLGLAFALPWRSRLTSASGVAVHAAAFHLAMRAGVAVRAVAFQLAMWAGVAVHAAVFQLRVISLHT